MRPNRKIRKGVLDKLDNCITMSDREEVKGDPQYKQELITKLQVLVKKVGVTQEVIDALNGLTNTP